MSSSSAPQQQQQPPPPQQTSLSPQDLRRRIKELEEENCQLALRLSRAGRHVNRLRLERKLLLERLETLDDAASAAAAAAAVVPPSGHPTGQAGQQDASHVAEQEPAIDRE